MRWLGYRTETQEGKERTGSFLEGKREGTGVISEVRVKEGTG